MTSLLQVRGVPEAARRVLKARAAARGQSLNAYVLEMIQREVARPTVAEVLERSAGRAEHLEGSAVPALEEARAGRDLERDRRSDE